MLPNYLLLKIVKFKEFFKECMCAQWSKHEHSIDICEMCNKPARLSQIRRDFVCFDCFLKPDLRQLIGVRIHKNKHYYNVNCLAQDDEWSDECDFCANSHSTKYYVSSVDDTVHPVICGKCVRGLL
jgi:hypothetical protein